MRCKVKGLLFTTAFVLCVGACSEMAGNEADVVDGTEVPLLNTPDYTVQQGDTLYSIAFAANIDFRLLAEMNHLKPPYHLRRGQIISLHTDRTIQLPEPSQAEQRQIDLLEPVMTQLPSPKAMIALATPPKLAKSVKKSQGKSKIGKLKNRSKSMVKDDSFNNNTKKVHQAQKKPKVRQTNADNSHRHSKLNSVSHQHSKRTLGNSVDKQPVHHWLWPTRGKVIATFDSGRVGNKGLDITGKLGSPVRAAAPGVVVYSGSGLRGYGNLIIIKHNARYLSAYAYNQELLVTEGTAVEAGQTIAKMGRANSGQVKLHFEIRRAGKPVDPKPYLS